MSQNQNTVPTFEELLAKMQQLHDAKGADYGDNILMYKNCRASERFNVNAWIGVAIRMTDKMSRLEAFAHQDTLRVDDETIEDTFLDIANYALIGAILFAEGRTNRQPMTTCLSNGSTGASEELWRLTRYQDYKKQSEHVNSEESAWKLYKDERERQLKQEAFNALAEQQAKYAARGFEESALGTCVGFTVEDIEEKVRKDRSYRTNTARDAELGACQGLVTTGELESAASVKRGYPGSVKDR